MKRKRKIVFNVKYEYVSGEGYNATYSHVADGSLIDLAIQICEKTNCNFIKMKCLGYERTIVIKANRNNFIKFVQNYIKEFMKDIEDIEF